MPNIKSSYNKIYFIAAIISGASLTLSFAPFRLWIFSYLSIASLIFLLNHSFVHIGYLGFFWGLGVLLEGILVWLEGFKEKLIALLGILH